MAFNAGAILATAKVNNSQWNSGLKGMVGGIGKLGAAVGVVAVAAMTKATKSANEWQKSLSNVNTLLDTTQVNSQDMAKSLLELDAELGSTKELTDAMYQSFSSGAEDMDEALKITTDAAKFARAGLTDTATAVDVLTTATNAYGKDVMSTEKASDIFFTTIKQGKINGEELSGVIGQSIPLFASLNVPLEQLGAGMAAMTKQGVASAESTTQLNAIMNSFLKPSEAMSAALKEQGIESGSALIESEGLAGALEFLDKATGGSKDALSELLPSTRAVRGALALTGTGGEEFTKILGEMENAAGATDEAFGKQEITWATMRNQMEKVELVAGNIGKFFVDDIAVGATKASKSMLQFLMSAQGAELVGNLIGGISAGFELLKITMEPILATIGPGLKDMLEGVKGSMATLKGETDGASPSFNLLAGASQFTALAFEVFFKVITMSTKSLIDFITIVKEGVQGIGTFKDMLTGDATWTEVKDSFSDVGDAFKNMGTNIMEGGADLWDTVSTGVKSFSDVVGEQAIEMEAKVTTSFASQKNNITSNWAEMITGQRDMTDEMMENFGTYAEEIITIDNETTDEKLSNIDKLKDAWKDHFKTTEGFAKSAFDSTLSAGQSLVSGISNIMAMSTSNTIDEIDLQAIAQTDALQARLDSGVISEEEYQEELEKIAQEATDEKNKANKKAFENNKSFKMADIWMSAAQGIASWWSSAGILGPIFGPAFAGTMTGATLAMAARQSQLVSEQKFVPARQFGGMASGPTRVNEVGGEIISLPDGSQVIPNDISKQIASDSVGSNILNFYGDLSFNNRDDIDYLVDQVSRELGKRMRGA